MSHSNEVLVGEFAEIKSAVEYLVTYLKEQLGAKNGDMSNMRTR